MLDFFQKSVIIKTVIIIVFEVLMKNYSKQREAILQVLRSTDTHPTAQWVYEQVRKTLPRISLGTVYRNLTRLRDEGVILGIAVGDGYEHFDGDASPHIHLHCRRCHRIADVRLSDDTPRKAAIAAGFIPDNEVYIIYGICGDCGALSDKDSENKK